MASRLSPKARAIAVVTGWLAAAATATGAGMFAVGAIGAGIVPAAPQPLDNAQVTALARSPQPRRPATGPTTATSAPTSTPTSTPTTVPETKPKVVGTAGGTVLASCAGQRVVVRSVSPAQGYQVESSDEEHHGGREGEVKFRSEDTDIKVRLRCADGEPRATIEREGDD